MDAFVTRRQMKKMRWENGRNYVNRLQWKSSLAKCSIFSGIFRFFYRIHWPFEWWLLASYLLYHSWMKNDGNGWATIWMNIKTEYSLLFPFRFKYHSVMNSRIQIEWAVSILIQLWINLDPHWNILCVGILFSPPIFSHSFAFARNGQQFHHSSAKYYTSNRKKLNYSFKSVFPFFLARCFEYSFHSQTIFKNLLHQHVSMFCECVCVSMKCSKQTNDIETFIFDLNEKKTIDKQMHKMDMLLSFVVIAFGLWIVRRYDCSCCYAAQLSSADGLFQLSERYIVFLSLSFSYERKLNTRR